MEDFDKMNLDDLQPWELLAKKITWQQLDFAHNMKILDFGSGNGITANHLAADNEVIAIEPSLEMLKDTMVENNYKQIIGSLDELRKMEDNDFDLIICHNVFEYASQRKEIINEFYRILKKGGKLSILKHNKPGRVMQMVVLLNNFEHANELLDGSSGNSGDFGAINYYNDDDLIKWCDGFEINQIKGLRTFWDLQQNQEIQKDPEWQEKMIEIETRVSDIKEYVNIAFFHHVILEKCK